MGNIVSLGTLQSSQSAKRNAEETHISRNNRESVTQKSSESDQLMAQQIWSHSIEISERPTRRRAHSLFDLGEATHKPESAQSQLHHSVKIQSVIMRRRQVKVEAITYSRPGAAERKK